VGNDPTGQGPHSFYPRAEFLETYYGDNTKSLVHSPMIARAILMLSFDHRKTFVNSKNMNFKKPLFKKNPESFWRSLFQFFKNPILEIALAFILSYRCGKNPNCKNGSSFFVG